MESRSQLMQLRGLARGLDRVRSDIGHAEDMIAACYDRLERLSEVLAAVVEVSQVALPKGIHC